MRRVESVILVLTRFTGGLIGPSLEIQSWIVGAVTTIFLEKIKRGFAI